MDSESKTRPKMIIVWRNVYLMSVLHILGLCGIVMLPLACYKTHVWSKYLVLND